MQISNLQQPIITIDYRVFFAVLLGINIFSYTLNAQNSTQTIKKEIYSDNQIKVEVEFKLYNSICKDLNKSNKYTYIVTGQMYSYAKEAYWNLKYTDCNGNQQNEKKNIPIGGKEAVIGRIESLDYIFIGKLDSNLPPPISSNLLSLSKTDISYKSLGGNENITVNSNSNPYTVEKLPSWCTVQKYSTYFTLNCINNYSSSSRTDYFNVKSGNQTIKVNVKQEGFSSVSENKLEVSKSDLFFSYDSGNIETINISTNAIDFYTTYVPNWCYVTKYKGYITVKCQKNDTGQLRSDWFKITVGNKEVIVYVNQEASVTNTGAESDKLGAFSSLGIQSGGIAKYGFIYEHGGSKTLGFRFSARTSLTTEQEIINGSATKNKTEFEIGTNYNIYKAFYLNFGIGFGYYKRLLNNDFSGSIFTEFKSYFVTTTGIMYRLNNQFNVNCGLAFMDIHEELYKPELTLGVTYNLKSITKNQNKTYSATSKNKSKNYYSSLPSFSSLGFQSGEIAKYGLLYETGDRKTVGFRISARTTLRPEQIFGGGDIENRKEIELGPNFSMSDHIYLNLGVGYGNYEFPPYQDKIGYYIATTGIMYRISRVININGGVSFNYIDNDIYFDNSIQKTEITFGISFNLRD